MIRRISTKLLLAVLAAVVIPFVGFAVFVDSTMADRLSRQVVLYSLKGLAAELASKIDRDVDQFNRDVALWAGNPLCSWAIGETDDEETAGEIDTFRRVLVDQFDAVVLEDPSYDLILLVNSKGRLVASSSVEPVPVDGTNGRNPGRELSYEVLWQLHVRDFSQEPWFVAGMRGEAARIDQHRSDLLPPPNPTVERAPENFHIGFAAPVYSEIEPERVSGVIFALVSWTPIQEVIKRSALKEYFQGLVGPEDFPSAYGWVWSSDADTIIAHEDPGLYGVRVSGPEIGLPGMVEDARSSDWGLYREYSFRDERKNAAYKHTNGPEDGGFGWVVGVGIDNKDIFKAVNELRGLLFKATLLVLLLAVLWTMVIARRTTKPIVALREHTQKVASGDLDARIVVSGQDELAELARAFNGMTAEIKEQREQIVKAEKDAAWREMARQIAHDIKNPLTPIKLSADLLKRARAEDSPQFDAIFERTMETISRQVDHLRDIASDFHALTGAHKPRFEVVDVGAMLGEVLELNAAWAEDLGVEVSRDGEGGLARADPALFRRVLINLVSNAFEAMQDGGGRLECSVRPDRDSLVVEIRDTGAGVPEEVRSRLFEPYFTTRSTGTGLGLAIARRVVEEHGGEIALEPAEPGTLARIRIPRVDA